MTTLLNEHINIKQLLTFYTEFNKFVDKHFVKLGPVVFTQKFLSKTYTNGQKISAL